MKINIKNFEKMKKVSEIAALILKKMSIFIKPGVKTEKINKIYHEEIIKHKAKPAPLNYKRYPKSICVSVNNIICHGIPNEKKIKNGDIINIDITIIIEGWHADTSETYYIGVKPPNNIERLIKVSYKAMMKTTSIIKHNINLCEIGRIIECYIKRFKYSIVKEYCGHGIGKKFHKSPTILHYYNKSNKAKIKRGMFFTIEPMINEGASRTRLLPDKWSVTTKDYTLSAQFEHTIGVTKTGNKILTKI